MAVRDAIKNAEGIVEEMTEPQTPMTWSRGSKMRTQNS
jgi:hypothetical protein